jgi:Rrf2 family protein
VEITRRTDYGIRLLLELARTGDGPVSARELAQRQGVPYAFARAVQRDLHAAGLVETVRGAKGGAVLARSPADITLLDAVRATQGTPSIAVCSNDPDWCGRSGSCAVHRVWCGADAMLRDYLGSKTLAGLTDEDGK